MASRSIVEVLAHHPEPSVRWKVETGVFASDPESPRMRSLREEVRRSPRARSLLVGAGVGASRARLPNPYQKWQGAHWALAALADVGYPRGDARLLPARDRVLDLWLAPAYLAERVVTRSSATARRYGVLRLRGRFRRCASQQGNALDYLLRLGIEDPDRSARLVERLLRWQWPDGGWNCDIRPAAAKSSFWETRQAMVALHRYGTVHRHADALAAARRASEVFLTRELFRRRSDGAVMRPEFSLLHYPLYWRYDVLGGLVAMAAIGRVRDRRCAAALDLLESKRLPDGGWPAERRYYSGPAGAPGSNADRVAWGPTGARASNPWVSADALSVLASAGRLTV